MMRHVFKLTFFCKKTDKHSNMHNDLSIFIKLLAISLLIIVVLRIVWITKFPCIALLCTHMIKLFKLIYQISGIICTNVSHTIQYI